MKRILKFGITAMVVISIVLAVGSCKVTIGTDGNGDDAGKDIDWTNYTTNAAIRVRNLTNQRLVLFKNELKKDAIIGGVNANAGGDGWGIKKDQKAFSTTDEFAMLVLTLDQYESNKNNLAAMTNSPFTRVYVFYNAAGENEILYEISDKLGGNYILQIENPSSLNVELRQGGVNGPTLGYAPAGMQMTRLYVQDGDLDFFPVFKRYNKQRNILETIYPKGVTGQPWMESFVFGEGYASPQAYDIREALKGTSGRTSGVAYLKIVNTSGGAVRLYKGSEMVYNTIGISYMQNNGNPTEFEILMPGTNNVFDQKITISNYKIGPTGGSVSITDKNGNTTFDLYADKSYTVTVTGNYNQNTLKAEIDIEEATDIPLDDFNVN